MNDISERVFFIGIVLILVLAAMPLFAWEYRDFRTLYGTTNTPVWACFSKDDSTGITRWFELQLRSVERTETISLPDVPTTIAVTYEVPVTVPKTGHWFLDVRACNDIGCSGWLSIENQRVITTTTCNSKPVTDDGSPSWIYGYIAPPSGGVVN